LLALAVAGTLAVLGPVWSALPAAPDRTAPVEAAGQAEQAAQAADAVGDGGPLPAADRTPTGEPVTIAFAGDVNAERGAGAALRAGLPSVREALSAPDLTVLNVEMAITERGERADKEFAFRAPARALGALRDAGVDVVSLANNHGLDYGEQGLRDTLSAAASTGLPVVGIGGDEQQAYAPHVVEVRGQRIAVLGATQVLDGSLQEAWTAGPGKPGLASAKREQRLLEEVARARQDADTVVVYLHWGRERDPCPLPRQESLARALVAAGADVVVGGHAHVPLGGGYLDGAYVDYGLGNFVFPSRGEGVHSGVLTLTVQGRAVRERPAGWCSRGGPACPRAPARPRRR
jgi:poly-gamma-glutamate synthesis protein (capsule biosynthesis protein)